MDGSPEFPSYHTVVDGVDVHYKCLGEGPVTILLHGVGSDWHQWINNIPFLARQFRTYALDIPGFGLSAPSHVPLTSHWSSMFLNKFMDALGIHDAHVVGHSLGGAFALAFASYFPEKVRRVVAIDSAGLGYLSWTGRALNYMFKVMSWVTGKNQSYRLSAKNEDWLLVSRLQAIKPRVLLVWGGRDLYFSLSQAKQAQKLIPDCRLYVFHCTCHAPQIEFTDEFNHVVHEFLTE